MSRPWAMRRPRASVRALDRSPASLRSGERAARMTITLISSAIARSAWRTTSRVTGLTCTSNSRGWLDQHVAEPIEHGRLAGIDERGGPGVLQERGPLEGMLGREVLAPVDRQGGLPQLGEVRPLLPRGDGRAPAWPVRKPRGIGRHEGPDAEVDALHGVARGVAVEPLVERFEIAAKRGDVAGPRHGQLVVLADVAHVDLPLELDRAD